MKEICEKLREKISFSVKKNKFNAILFSGGLDTSILIYENLKNLETIGINVRLENFGEDVEYARELSKILNFKLYEISVSVEEAINAIPEVIKILKTFDPAIPNDLPIYFGVKFLKNKIKAIATGDGSDELFAGYKYMENIRDLNEYIKNLDMKNRKFSSNKICKFFKIKCLQPYLDEDLINFSLSIPKDMKIRKENGKIYGKWILRKSYENLIPKKFIWQEKRPLEIGSGFEKLRKILESKISDYEFKEKKEKYKIKFMSKEHLYYYEIYREVVGEIIKARENEKECPFCGAGMKNLNHCEICGGNLSDYGIVKF